MPAITQRKGNAQTHTTQEPKLLLKAHEQSKLTLMETNFFFFNPKTSKNQFMLEITSSHTTIQKGEKKITTASMFGSKNISVKGEHTKDGIEYGHEEGNFF